MEAGVGVGGPASHLPPVHPLPVHPDIVGADHQQAQDRVDLGMVSVVDVCYYLGQTYQAEDGNCPSSSSDREATAAGGETGHVC